ncbi:O-GlcNAcase NagJ precursor [Virgibacillus salexigens]|uniref:O-GlcNAcase NagJ n=1 Tax=Virgibacillus massiliensis TaxID=1462526 RepID=A0A024Q8I7_9BACI|nr:O-GlcNAcase NagJ precursor [Virgibacillus massiliensis]
MHRQENKESASINESVLILEEGDELYSHSKSRSASVWKNWLMMFVLMMFVVASMMLNKSNVVQAEEESEITVNPKPQHLQVTGNGFPLTPVVGIVVGDDTDEKALQHLKKTLKNNDVKRIVIKEHIGDKPHTPTTIFLGGPSENENSSQILKNLDMKQPTTIKDDGYVLATNADKKLMVLAGKDKTGTYYATQTFEQLIQERPGRNWVPSVAIIDWPEMPLRGSIEGFYGPPWSHEDRLSQIEFYGDNKLNSYIYAPKDDPYHREDWREPYPEEKLKELQELVDQSKENHVDFTFSLSPGNTVCYSGDEDFELLMNKMETVWDLGVRSYAIFLDDISYELHCDQDKEMFGDDPNPTAAAQAYLLNRFEEAFIDTHEGANALITVPTDYAGTHTNTYRERFAALTNEDIVVMWTGPNVVSESITSEGASQVSEIFGHELLLWDNYPVNDFDRNRLFLGPLVNRDSDLTENGVTGLIANPMNEAEASKIPLYTIADYTWNPYHYDPETSWENSVQDFGGDAAAYVKTFAENAYSSRLSDKESLTIKPLIKRFWDVYESDGDISKVASTLIHEFQKLQTTPENLRNHLNNQQFLGEISPYLDKLALYGEAGVEAVHLLLNEREGNEEEAAKHREKLQSLLDRLEEIPQKMGEFVFDPFLIQALYGEYVLSRPLDGVNQSRGANQLIQYTPEHGDTTGTNIYGYEVTVVDGEVVKRGGNNSDIPDNGYVLSIHGSDWLRENALMGAEVEIKDDRVMITIPK